MKNTQLPVLTKEYQRQAAGMIRQYADKLIQMGYGFTRRQLKEMNYIDVQEFFEKKSNHNSMKREYLDLGKEIGTFGYSVKKKTKKPQKRRKKKVER